MNFLHLDEGNGTLSPLTFLVSGTSFDVNYFFYHLAQYPCWKAPIIPSFCGFLTYNLITLWPLCTLMKEIASFDLILFHSSMLKKLTFPSHFPEPHSSLLMGVMLNKENCKNFTKTRSNNVLDPAGTKRSDNSINSFFAKFLTYNLITLWPFCTLVKKMTTPPSQPFLTEVGGTSFDSRWGGN